MTKQTLLDAISEAEKAKGRPVEFGDLPIQFAFLDKWLMSRWIAELCDEHKIFLAPSHSTGANFFFTTTAPQ